MFFKFREYPAMHFVFLPFIFVSIHLALTSFSDEVQAKEPKATKSSNLQPQNKGKIKLGLNWKAEPQFGGFFEAEQKGFFKKAGLKVEILEGGSGTPTLQMLLSGRLDYAVVSADELVVAHSQGRNQAVAIFASFQSHPQCLMTHASVEHQKIEHILADPTLTLQWQQGLPYAQYLSSRFKEEIKIKRVPYQGGIAVFRRNPKMVQQCFVSSEPLLAEEAGIATKVIPISDSGFNPYATVVVVNRERLDSNKNEVEKMVKALQQAWESYLKDPTLTNKWIAQKSPGLTLEFLSRSSEAQKSLIEVKSGQTLGQMSVSRWLVLTEQMLDAGVVKNQVDPEQLFISIKTDVKTNTKTK